MRAEKEEGGLGPELGWRLWFRSHFSPAASDLRAPRGRD